MTLRELQQVVDAWVKYNFPNQVAYQPLLGVVEEVGELSHSHLKEEQNIRGSVEEHQAKAKDAIGDIVIYLCNYCSLRGFDLESCVDTAWREVRDRDWQKNSRNGLG